MDYIEPDTMADILGEERVKSAVEKWAAIGLWDRIRAKKQRGEKPAKPGDKDYPDSKSWSKVTAESEKKAELFAPRTPMDYNPQLHKMLQNWEHAGGDNNLFGSGSHAVIDPALAKALSRYVNQSNRHEAKLQGVRAMKVKPHEVDDLDAVNTLMELESTQPKQKAAASTPAWQRSAGKNDEGGLNAKGRASYNRETGGNLKAPVTEKNPKGERAGRQNSFCARMCGMKKHETGSKTKSDPDSRINKSLRKWNCKCGSEQKQAQDFDPAMSRDAENAIMHGTGLVGSTALGTLAGLPVSAGLEQFAKARNWIPSSEKSPFGHNLANSLLKIPMFVGGTLGLSLYDNYILRPHMKRELERKKQEEEVRQQLAIQKQAAESLGRILGTALASTGGGLALGGYPGWKLQQASESAGNSDFTNFIAGKAPIALAGALSAAAYNHAHDQYEKKNKPKKQPEPTPESMKYLRYLVH
jgi:hypothetical protein